MGKAPRHGSGDKSPPPGAKSTGLARRAKQRRHGVSKLPGYVYAQKGTRAEIKARACAYCGPKQYRTDQFVVDNLLPEFTGSQKLCFDIIVRHSTGCSQPSAHLSLNDFAGITGRAKGTVIRVLRSLDRAGLIERIPHQAPDGSCAKTEYRVTIPGLEADPDGGFAKEKTRPESQRHPAGAGDLDIRSGIRTRPCRSSPRRHRREHPELSECGRSRRPGHRPEIRTRPTSSGSSRTTAVEASALRVSATPAEYHTPRDFHPSGIPPVQGQTGSQRCMRPPAP